MDIKLSELDYKITMYSFYNTLLNNNIRTVKDLLDDKLMAPILARLRKTSRDELRGFIDLVKYQFGGPTLPSDILLEQKMRPLTEEEKMIVTKQGIGAINYPINFSRMAITTREAMALYYVYVINQRNNDEELRLIDVFKLYTKNSKDTTLTRKIKSYLDSYEKNRSTDVELDRLKSELQSLMDERTKIELAISKVESRIDAYEAIKGSMQK